MHFEALSIPGLALLTEERIADQRGYFSEVFRSDLFERHVGPFGFVQENQSCSVRQGTVRGLHFQLAPRAQGKLVRCIAGAVFDVAVDIREGSPTYGRHVAVELTSANGMQLWIPAGFAHGFCTLQPHTVIGYRVTDYFSAEHDRGLRWNDPAIGIDWPLVADEDSLSGKDRDQPKLAELQANFVYA
jgi:dTDP-4-dehydrorhamnose 3,5-epimerase